jgi:hypothetical protein
MSATSHTEGPWKIEEPDYEADCVWIRAADPLETVVAEIPLHRPDSQLHGADLANANLISAAPDFHTACSASDGDSTRLDWLSSLLADLRETGWANTAEDPEAAWTALRESEALLEGLRAAVKKAEGGG